MLGILLIYWVGKRFYSLAETYNENKWAFAILGIVSYYGGIIVFGFVTGIVVEWVSPGYIETISDILLGVMLIPFGILTCYAFYKILENYWKDKKFKEEALKENIESE